MTPRECMVYLRQLPTGAALWRSMFGEDAPWGTQEHLLAAQLDVLEAANWQRSMNKQAPRPKPTRRPNPGRAEANQQIVGRLRRLGLV